jgi:hypothetical protein
LLISTSSSTASGVGGEHGQRAVQRDQVAGDGVVVDAHEAHRQARALLAGQAGLEQADHALAAVAHAQQQDLALAIGHRHLVRRDQRHAAPGDELAAEQADGGRRRATARGFAAEGGNGQRVGQEEGGFLPDLGQQLVQVVGGGRAGQREDALLVAHLGQQAVVGVVDQLAFLVFLDGLDGQAQLFLDLVVRAAVEVGDAGVHIQHGGDRVQEVLARLGVVVHKGARQLVLVLLGGAGDLDVLRVLDLVEAVDAGLHRHPLQQMGQPARRDGGQLRCGLGGIGKLAGCVVAQGGGTADGCCHGKLLVESVVGNAGKQSSPVFNAADRASTGYRRQARRQVLALASRCRRMRSACASRSAVPRCRAWASLCSVISEGATWPRSISPT